MSMRIHTAMADAIAVEYMTAKELEDYDSELDDLPGGGLVIEDAGNCEAMVLCGDRNDALQFAKRVAAAARPVPPVHNPEDFVAVEAADRVYFWDVVMYDSDEGKPLIINSFRHKSEADALRDKVAEVFKTWSKELSK